MEDTQKALEMSKLFSTELFSTDEPEYITSFVDAFTLVKNGMVSRDWESLWSRVPYCLIDIPDYLDRHNMLAPTRETIRHFVNFTYWFICSKTPENLRRLTFTSENHFDREEIHCVIAAAASRKVQQLFMCFDPSQEFSLPCSLVRGNSLQVLEIDMSLQTLRLPRCVGFQNLRYMCLSRVRLTDEDSANGLFSKCKSLQHLIINHSVLQGINILNISSNSIQSIFLSCGQKEYGYDNTTIQVSCPRLRVFRYSAPIPKKLVLTDVSQLETLHMFPFVGSKLSTKSLAKDFRDVIERARNLLELQVVVWLIEEISSNPKGLYFCRLKALSLRLRLSDRNISVVYELLKKSPNLERLTLYFDKDNGKQDESLGFRFPVFRNCPCLNSSLRTIEIINFNGTDREVCLLESLLDSSNGLKTLRINWTKDEKCSEVESVVTDFTTPTTSVSFISDASKNGFQKWTKYRWSPFEFANDSPPLKRSWSCCENMHL